MPITLAGRLIKGRINSEMISPTIEKKNNQNNCLNKFTVHTPFIAANITPF
ncbi:hypothetical protein TOTSKI_13760 [Facklamia hominis]